MVNFLIFLLFKQNLCNSPEKNSMATFWKYLRWSFYWLWRGQWPTHDAEGEQIRDHRAGTQLAEGYYATIWLVRGDLDYFANTLKLENVASRTPCMKCRCNLSTTTWTTLIPLPPPGCRPSGRRRNGELTTRTCRNCFSARGRHRCSGTRLDALQTSGDRPIFIWVCPPDADTS